MLSLTIGDLLQHLRLRDQRWVGHGRAEFGQEDELCRGDGGTATSGLAESEYIYVLRGEGAACEVPVFHGQLHACGRWATAWAGGGGHMWRRKFRRADAFCVTHVGRGTTAEGVASFGDYLCDETKYSQRVLCETRLYEIVALIIL